jgi:PEP-CTERM motif
MKRRPTLLLCGAVLIAAAPVWADTIPYTGTSNDFDNTPISANATRISDAKLNTSLKAGFLPVAAPTTPSWAYTNLETEFAGESPTVAISTKVTRSSGMEPNAPANADFSAEQAAPTGELIGSFTANNALEVWGSTRAPALDKLLLSSSALDDIRIYSTNLGELDFHESSSSIVETGRESHNVGDGENVHGTGEHRRRANSVLPVSVPEPGSLSLFLVGLTVVGLLGRRRVHRSSATSAISASIAAAEGAETSGNSQIRQTQFALKSCFLSKTPGMLAMR